MPLRPSGTPMPGVGAVRVMVPPAGAGCAGSGVRALCAVPAGGTSVVGCASGGVVGAVTGWSGGGTCGAAGVSPAAAKAIAHPISLIFTPVTVIGTEGARCRASLKFADPYRRGFREPQAPVLALPTGVEAAVFDAYSATVPTAASSHDRRRNP